MDGYQVCEQLKADEGTRDIPVIFLSALNEAFDKVKAFAAGGLDYVAKPFSPRELVARVKAVLRRFPGEDAGTGARDDSPFHIDHQRMEIRYLGKRLELSRYEFRILEVLIKRPGWVFTRDQLMDIAWEAPESIPSPGSASPLAAAHSGSPAAPLKGVE